VVCFGEILWDVFQIDPAGRTYRFLLGGAPANVATGLARLGIRASLVGGIGKDRFGADLEKHLAADGVITEHLVRLPNRTGLTFVSRDRRGEPSFLFYRHETADVSVGAEHIAARMCQATWGLVGTSTLMTPRLRRATSRFMKCLRKQGGHLVVDLNVRAHMWKDADTMRRRIAKLLCHADLIKASEADLVALGGRFERGMDFVGEHAPKTPIFVTRGGNVASALFQGKIVEALAHHVRCIDATGAGDAFLAGALAVLVRRGAVPGSAAFADERVWRAALEVGHGLGAKAVSSVGSVSGLTDLGELVGKVSGKAGRRGG
jgi:fructokinase